MAIIYVTFYKRVSVYNGDETVIEGTIYKKKINDEKITLYLDARERIVVNYYGDENVNLSLGDKVRVTGVMKVPKNNTIPNMFNYKNYLYNEGIFYSFNASSILKIENNTNIIYYLRNLISKRIDKIYRANDYVKVFILGDTSMLDEEAVLSYRGNGISHLFSISGMHISLFASIILFILKRVSYNNFYNYGMVILFLGVYTLLVGSSPSVIRSLIMYILFSLNKLFNLKVKNVDVMLIVLIIMLVVNPYYLLNISFQYSYLISFTLVLFSKRLKGIKNNLIKSLYISFISFMVSFPICVYNFYQVNLLSIFLNLLVIPLVNVFIFPLSLLSFIFPFMSYFLGIFTGILEWISVFIYELGIGVVGFAKPSLVVILVYYILIYLFLYDKRFMMVFLMMVIHKYYIYFDSDMEVLFLDVGQGDSILMKMPYNRGNIMIDTGGVMNSDYSLVMNKTIPYLKSIGVNRLDYLIITHGDYDHMRDAIDLVSNFNVDRVLFNKGEFNSLELELIKVLEENGVSYYQNVDELNVFDEKLYFLGDKIYDNENDNSSVLYMKYDRWKFLLMGDASLEVEDDLLGKYRIRDIDVLKVGHHGSRTSSGSKFIDYVNPRYGVISVGERNLYKHPNKEVLDNLKDVDIYRTDKDGSIMFRIRNGKFMIESFTP